MATKSIEIKSHGKDPSTFEKNSQPGRGPSTSRKKSMASVHVRWFVVERKGKENVGGRDGGMKERRRKGDGERGDGEKEGKEETKKERRQQRLEFLEIFFGVEQRMKKEEIEEQFNKEFK